MLALAAAALLVVLQPVHAAWWHSADPDGPYTGNSLNILLGNHTSYLDHPGLPTQDVLALAFGARFLAEKATGNGHDREAFVDEVLLDLDQARPIYRTWALVLFFGGTVLVFALVSRLLGHWTWGLAGSLLFISAPSLAAISHVLRPDAALAALCLAVGFLVITGFERRSAGRYSAAGMLLGLAMTFKITAVGMAVPLVVAAVWRPPGADSFRPLMAAAKRGVRRHAVWLLPAALWLALCWIFNRERLPVVQTDDQRSILVNGATFLGAYALFALLVAKWRIPWADRVFRLSYLLIMIAFVAGLALPASLVLDDGVQMLVVIKETLAGGRVNEGIEPFESFAVDPFFRYPLAIATVVLALGLAAGAVGLARRCYWPFLLAIGSVVLAVMAAARFSFDYYYAPAVVVSVPGALWLFRRADRPGAPVYVLLTALLVVAWSASHLRSSDLERNVAADLGVDAAAQSLADRILDDGQVILVPSYNFPVEDVRFGSLVEGFADHVPDYPYRFLAQPHIAAEHGLTPAFYVAGASDLPVGTATIDIGGFGPFTIERLPERWGPHGEYGVARILNSPPLEP